MFQLTSKLTSYVSIKITQMLLTFDKPANNFKFYLASLQYIHSIMYANFYIEQTQLSWAVL